jgi:hypothetical protein
MILDAALGLPAYFWYGGKIWNANMYSPLGKRCCQVGSLKKPDKMILLHQSYSIINILSNWGGKMGKCRPNFIPIPK